MTLARGSSAPNADSSPQREDSPAGRDGRSSTSGAANPQAIPAGNPPAGEAPRTQTPSGKGGAGAARSSAQASITQLLKSLTGDLIGQVSGRVHLVALELRRARQALLQMVVLVIAAGIFMATAWIAFWVVVVTLAVASGLSWYGAVALVLFLNMVGGWLAFRRARALSVYLTLPATVRRLTVAPSVTAGDGAAETGAEATPTLRPVAHAGTQPGASGP